MPSGAGGGSQKGVRARACSLLQAALNRTLTSEEIMTQRKELRRRLETIEPLVEEHRKRRVARDALDEDDVGGSADGLDGAGGRFDADVALEELQARRRAACCFMSSSPASRACQVNGFVVVRVSQ